MRAKQPRRLGVYAGSFDPLTVGHLWMIEQGVLLFDRLVVAIGTNLDKRYTFTMEERMGMLRASLKTFRNVSVVSFTNRYLIAFAQSLGATHVLRGIRSESDYEYERTMRYINGDLGADICTVQKLGKWKSLSMVRRYAHHYSGSLRPGVEVLDKARMDHITKISHSDEIQESANP